MTTKITSNTYIGVGVVVLIVSAVIFVMTNLGGLDKRVSVLENNVEANKEATVMLRADVERVEDNQVGMKEDLAVIKDNMYRILELVGK